MLVQRPQRGVLRWDVAMLLRPLIRAYVLGYASSTLPRLLTVLVTYLSKRGKASKGKEAESIATSLRLILRKGLELQRFPTFCAALVGGATFLQLPLRFLLPNLTKSLSSVAQERLVRWTATFIAAWLSLELLQSKESMGFVDKVPVQADTPTGTAIRPTKFAGRTMDLTLFALTRALDVTIGELWHRRKSRRVATKSWTRIETLVSNLTDTGVFAASCALIMWAWIYVPERLPRGYNKWISSAAAVDSRLLTALRRCQWGELVYGRETGQAPLLGSMCDDYGWPREWGDPAQSVPFPCEIVHMGTGKSCEWHAVRRFTKGFMMAAGMYVPLNLALQLRNPSLKGVRRALLSSIRSSAFLGSFIALFYYGICLARTRVGPRILGTDAKSCQWLDGGAGIGTGCMVCGWSILLENAGRRKDIALFVAPKALATILPRRYQLKYQWRETATFAMSTAIVFTCAQENPARVRGVLGKLLATVLVP